MEFIKKWSGVIGGGLLFMGIVSLPFVREKPYIWGPVVGLGSLSVIVYLYLNFDELKSASKRKAFLYGSSMGFTLLLFFIFMIFINVLSSYVYSWVDLTSEKIFSLSPKTRKVLQEFEKKHPDEEIKVYAFFKEGTPEWGEMKDLLEKYRYYSKRIKYEFIDPEKNPTLAQEYSIKAFNTTVVVWRDNKNRFTERTEEALTNAIIKVTREEKKRICFLTGHGEKSISEFGEKGYSKAKSEIESQGLSVKEINLFEKGEVPEECSVLVIAGPERKLVPQEIDSIKKYFDAGGSVMVMVDPLEDSGIQSMLKEYGVDVDINGVVVDPLSRLFGGHFTMPVITSYEEHDITKDFNYAAIFPLSSMLKKGNPPEGYKVVPLAKTSPKSWFERRLDSKRVEYNRGVDEKGPITLAMVVERESEEGEKGGRGRMVVFSDSDFVSNSFYEFSGNGDLFLNSINWLAQEEDIVSISPRKRESKELNLSASTGKFLFYITSIFIPMAVIITGISIWSYRRHL